EELVDRHHTRRFGRVDFAFARRTTAQVTRSPSPRIAFSVGRTHQDEGMPRAIGLLWPGRFIRVMDLQQNRALIAAFAELVHSNALPNGSHRSPKSSV